MLLLLAALAVVSFYFRDTLLRHAGGYLVVRDADAPADAIVVLSGSLPDRILHGVDLFKQGMAPIVVLTREVDWPGAKELQARGIDIPERYELNREIARQLGVPDASLLLVDEPVGSTITEVAALLPELRRHNVHSMLLVTSKTHTRRAALIFDALSGGDIEVRVSPTPYDPFSPDDWWHKREMVRRVLTEYGKLLTFNLFERWSATPTQATTR